MWRCADGSARQRLAVLFFRWPKAVGGEAAAAPLLDRSSITQSTVGLRQRSKCHVIFFSSLSHLLFSLLTSRSSPPRRLPLVRVQRNPTPAAKPATEQNSSGLPTTSSSSLIAQFPIGVFFEIGRAQLSCLRPCQRPGNSVSSISSRWVGSILGACLRLPCLGTILLDAND